jgi:hypothetical protein
MKRLAWYLRCLADRIDPDGAHREGIRFRDDGKGCPLWYLGRDSYERAHAEADKRGDRERAVMYWPGDDPASR